MKNELCRCYSGRAYKDCCCKLHQGEAPQNALALMRSRYCAYALGNIDYILSTTHKDNPIFMKPHHKMGIKHFCESTEFKGLEIINFTDGDAESTVTFHAILWQNGSDCSFTEKSLFKKVGDFWKYYGVINT